MLKSVLNTCLKTKESLQEMIPLMEEVVKLMGGIGNVWDEVKINLDELTANSAVWWVDPCPSRWWCAGTNARRVGSRAG